MAGIVHGVENHRLVEQAEQEAAEAAQETAGAAYSPDNMPYVAGTYTGNYGTTTVELGFCPQLLIIAGDSNSSSQSGRSTSLGSYFGVIGGDHNYETVTLSGTGFSVRNGTTYPELNEGNITYLYIAFR
mgnify:CR=1 FL=1